MKKFILTLILTLCTLSSFAQTIDWDLFGRAFSTQARIEDTTYGTFAILENETAIEGGVNRQYFSAIGGFNEDAVFVGYRHELVSEDWTIVDGNFHIDQWLFALNADKEIIFYLHRKMIQTPDRVVLYLENIPESEERYFEKTQELLSYWMNILK